MRSCDKKRNLPHRSGHHVGRHRLPRTPSRRPTHARRTRSQAVWQSDGSNSRVRASFSADVFLTAFREGRAHNAEPCKTSSSPFRACE